jgi:hypothetical protein
LLASWKWLTWSTPSFWPVQEIDNGEIGNRQAVSRKDQTVPIDRDFYRTALFELWRPIFPYSRPRMSGPKRSDRRFERWQMNNRSGKNSAHFFSQPCHAFCALQVP